MNNNDKPAFFCRSHGINKSDLAETAHRYNIVRLEIVCVGRYNTPIYRCLTVLYMCDIMLFLEPPNPSDITESSRNDATVPLISSNAGV